MNYKLFLFVTLFSTVSSIAMAMEMEMEMEMGGEMRRPGVLAERMELPEVPAPRVAVPASKPSVQRDERAEAERGVALIRSVFPKYSYPLKAEQMSAFEQEVITPLKLISASTGVGFGELSKTVLHPDEVILIQSFHQRKREMPAMAEEQEKECGTAVYVNPASQTCTFEPLYIKLMEEAYVSAKNLSERNELLRAAQIIENRDEGSITFIDPYMVIDGEKIPFSDKSSANAMAHYFGFPYAMPGSVETSKVGLLAKTKKIIYSQGGKVYVESGRRVIHKIRFRLPKSVQDLRKILSGVEAYPEDTSRRWGSYDTSLTTKIFGNSSDGAVVRKTKRGLEFEPVSPSIFYSAWSALKEGCSRR